MRTCNPAEGFKASDAQELFIDIRKILLATDGSTSAISATTYAIGLARLFKAKVRAVFVVNDANVNGFPDEPGGNVSDLNDAYFSGYKGIAIASQCAKENDVVCEERVERGNVPRNILKNASEFLPDLIIIGNSEKSGIRRTLGSVVDAVIKGTDIPVLVVRDT